jgi:hypothetical protein
MDSKIWPGPAAGRGWLPDPPADLELVGGFRRVSVRWHTVRDMAQFAGADRGGFGVTDRRRHCARTTGTNHER